MTHNGPRLKAVVGFENMLLLAGDQFYIVVKSSFTTHPQLPLAAVMRWELFETVTHWPFVYKIVNPQQPKIR